jgi:HSP20 family molecular chaperone IbpA
MKFENSTQKRYSTKVLIPSKNSQIDFLNSPIINQFKMDINDDGITVKLKINGLIGKNYKIAINENHLIVSALYKTKELAKNNNKISTFNTNFLLPCKVNETEIWSDVIDGLLHIKLSK